MGKGAINRWGTEFKPGDKVEWTTVGGVTFRGTYLKLEPPSDFSRAYGRQALVRLEDSLDCMMPGLGDLRMDSRKLEYNADKYFDFTRRCAVVPSDMKPGDRFMLQSPHPFAGDSAILAEFYSHVCGVDKPASFRCKVHGHDELSIVDVEHLPVCHKCKRVCIIPDGVSTGYGATWDEAGMIMCFECCARDDLNYMQTHDKVSMYLVSKADEGIGGGPRKRWYVTNWPGALKIPVGYVDVNTGYGFGSRYQILTGNFWLDMPDGTRTLWSVRVQGNMDCGTARRIKPRTREQRRIAAGGVL